MAFDSRIIEEQHGKTLGKNRKLKLDYVAPYCVHSKARQKNLQTDPWASVILSVLPPARHPVFLFYSCRSEIIMLCQRLSAGYNTSDKEELKSTHV